MKKHSVCLIVALLVLFTHSVWAGVIKGRVYDDQGMTLPYATVFVEGTTIGTTANAAGDYELVLAPGLYKIVCQFISFKQASFNVTIKGDEVIEHKFTLASLALEMKEVVVHANAEDPAYGIIREAIKKRKFHLDQIKSFQTSIYLKGVVRSRALPDKFMGEKVKSEDMGVDSGGKGVLYLTEEDADYYTDGENERTVIHSVHESGNKNGLGFSRFPPVVTFYENNVRVMGRNSRGFISPISDNAIFYYRYKLLGEFVEHGHTVYKIQVKQRRAYEPCFNGTIYITDTEFAIHSLDMMLTKLSGIDMFDTFSINQIFLPLDKETWVAKSQVLFFALKIMSFDVTGNFVTVYNNQKANQPIPDSTFSGNVVSTYDKTANKRDSSYWQSRPVPLADDEKKDFVVKDSINKKTTSPEYIDSVRRKENKPGLKELILTGNTWDGPKYKNSYSVNPVFISLGGDNILNYNIVEGFNVAPKFTWKHMHDTGKYFYFDMAARYGFSNTHFNAIGRMYRVVQDRSWLNRQWTFGAEGGKYVFQYNPDNPVLQWFNTYSALFYRQNDLKIYERWEASAFVSRNYGNGLNWFVKASWQHRLPLFNTTDFAIFKGNEDGFTPNVPPSLYVANTVGEHKAALLHAELSYKPGYTYTQYPDYKAANGSSWPRFTLIYDKGIPDVLDSKTDYDKWRFSVRDDVRLRLLGSLSYNFAIGGFLTDKFVGIPDLKHLYGNRGIGYAAPYLNSFQFAQYYDWSNREEFYAEGHVEYHLNGLLSNKIPLLRQARYYLLLGGNAFYSNDNFYYAEGFVGIDNIGWKLFRILRVDFVQSWDSRMGHNSGVRFGLNFPGATVVRNNPSHSEW